MTPRIPAVLSPVDLPAAELSAARLDGDLFTIGGCFAPVDLPEQAVGRAQSLAQHLSGRVIVELFSAAWVLGVIDTGPTAPQFCSAADARAKPATLRRLSVREVVIEVDEIVLLGGVRVTSPLRTACDLVRSSAEFGASVQLTVLRLLALGSATVDDCIALLERRRNLPGKRRTVQRLRSLSVPTRVDAVDSGGDGSAVTDAIDVVDGVDATHGVEHPIEVGGVSHFEDELTEGEAIGRGRNRRGEDVHVVL